MMTITITDIPNMQVISMVHIMRQELFVAYPIREIESLIHYCFKEICGMSRMDVLMRSEDRMDGETAERFMEVLERLKNHEPIQYIFGHSEFYGVDILLNKHVLIPRPETEELVHWIYNDHKTQEPERVLDIGTGSGCIALAIKSKLTGSEVMGIDVDPEVVRMARKNATHNELNVDFRLSNILDEPANLGTFDLIVSNPPYVTVEQMGGMMPNVMDYEPHLALFIKGDDPLKFYKSIAHFCQTHLSEDGELYVEINEDLAHDTVSLLESHNFTRTTIKKDLNGKFRMVKAMW